MPETPYLATNQPRITLNDGRTIPQLGYGVWQIEDGDAERVVGLALEAGYRHVDTARMYDNERGVGRAIAASGLARDDIFVTTKVWNGDQGYDSTLAAGAKSCERLGIDAIDLYLIHWAQPGRGLYVDTWRALIELQRQGIARSIGVSNFPKTQLDEIIDATGVTPAVHQIELHPYFNQSELRAYDDRLGIKTEAWSPLGQGGDVLTDPVVEEIAREHGATPAQVVIAWHLGLGNIVIPKSATPERITENFESLQVPLTPDEIARIDALTRPDGRIGADPAENNRVIQPQRD